MGRSLQNDLASDSARMLGDTTQFATSVSYTPPRSNDAVAVVGIWRVTGHAEVDRNRGKEVVATAELQTASEVDVMEEGRVTINGEAWVVKSVGRVMFGQRTIYCHGTTVLHRAPGSKP